MGNKYDIMLVRLSETIEDKNRYGEIFELLPLSKCLNNGERFFLDSGGGVIDRNYDLSYSRIYGLKKKIEKRDYNKLTTYIFVEKGDEITDVLRIPLNRTYALKVKFNNEYKRGMLTGTWDQKKLYLKIEKLYRLTDEGKLIKLDLKEIDKIAEFPFIDSFNYIEDDGTYLLEDFEFGI